uniref:BZIP domain-containing protein n=1 Tax=Photinus pyralis TaxID=7054 RepID=A0A1Y1JZ41_PHOPY
METFAVDKDFYDIDSADDLKELWDSELDPTMQDVLKVNAAGDLTVEWSLLEKDIPGIILHDRLMTDAALGRRPIKQEHSYSLTSDGDSLPDSPISGNKMDDMEDECFPAISLNTACGRLTADSTLLIKDEPVSESESPQSSCPSSPQPMHHSDTSMDTDNPTCQGLLKQTSMLLRAPSNIFSQTIHIPKLDLKIEPGIAFNLPPTPPSSSSSSEDSEDNGTSSQPSSPAIRKTNNRVVITNHPTTTRQPIHTPLISSQPKGSTGLLTLTEEEKRTLIAEGYPVPTRLPLTKAEEKSLKKIRRKIKNKISAQESRRKKKEYMDQLERKVELLVSENNDYRKKIETLEDSNSSLLSQLAKLQALVARTHPQTLKTTAVK